MVKKLADSLYWPSAIAFMLQVSFVATLADDASFVVPWQYMLLCSATLAVASGSMVVKNWFDPLRHASHVRYN